jgi:lysophospholipase L1-like esterase
VFEIMCFGDSNTWGYDPATGGRFPGDVRWTGVLQAELGPAFRVIEEGLNGRTTVWEDPVEGDKMGRRHLVPCLESQAPLDLVVLMLGTNDLKMRCAAPASDIAAGVGVLLDIIARSTAGRAGAAPRVLLLAPPPLVKLTAYAEMLEGGTEKSLLLGKLYAELARAKGCAFLDAGKIVRASDLDGVHLERAEHRALGAAIAREAARILEERASAGGTTWPPETS